ncbi:MAG: hypothetical protein QOI63_222, partial [Thermoplasmata archaeon]|nr:hypothetical protein [Thermoplasmata archaeon]
MNRLHKVAAGLGVAAVAVLGAVALLPHGAPAGADPGAGVASGAAPAPVDVARFLDTLKAQGYNVTLDSNHNGIPDVLKNFLYGSSLVKASTTGNGIPDGWLARNGFDPTLPGIELRLAAEPPAEALPPAYHGSWPEEFRWKLADVYAAGNATGVSLDPREWKGAGGIPSSWLHHHGLPLDRDVSQQPAAGGQSILQAYQDNHDPRDADADADGLPDVLEATRYHTDPHRASTTGSGVPDGWLVRFGLDPLDDTLASRDVAGKGMTVRDTWLYDVAHGGRAAALGGGGLDPTKMSQRGDRVPDGWLVRFGLDPLDAGVTGTVLQCAYDFPGLRERSSAPGQPTLPDLCLTVADDYAFGRPGGWDEAKQGPWLGGLDPSKKDQTGAGLPDAAGLHGWYVRRALDVGPSPAATWIRATTDPQRSDGDGDGLTDFEEFRGSAVREGVTYSFSPSDPGNVDTAFSGITDAEKAFATLGGTQLKGLLRHQPDGTVASWLDTARADTAGSYLTDGQYLAYWTAEAAAAGRGASYKEAHPGSLWNGYGDWLAPAGSPPLSRGEAAARLAPDGRVGGADADAPNLANPFPDRSDIPAGWKLQPLLVRFASPQQVHQSDERALDAHRAPLDPANPDTDGDRLKDGWELKHGTFLAFGQSEGEAKMLLPAGGFDLDPANAASFGSAVQDGEQNFDKDTVAWVSYSRASPGAPATPDPVHAFAFTNRFKVAADADPHVADGDSDGVTDGWVHFWRQCYPDPKCLKPSEQGDVVPSADDLAAHRIGDTRPGEQLKATLGYFRFVTQETPPALDAANGEALAGGTNPLPVSRGGGTVHVYTIVGTARESLADDAKAGLNPYLASTRGDGVPDVWKVYYGGQPECQAPDPRFPGASKRVFDPIKSDVADDPDGDSLSTAQEAALKTHPCKADSRGDGVDDGTAYRAGGMHLVPGGAQERAEGSVDTDSDGVPDKTELASGTDPTRADTAFAGLLDGPDQCRAASDPVVVGAPGKPGFLAQGIAHRHATTADAPCRGLSNPVLLFLGTHPGRNAAKQDSLSKGIPDGWTTYFGQSGGQGYACSRPAWWDEPRLGPWWWGTPGPCASRDLDRDGLDDRNGEDPVPAASQGSADATAGSVLRAALRNPAADAGTLRLLGQAFGDGAGTGDCAGDPSSCFNAWAPRTLPAAQLDFLNAGQPDGKLGKEDHFTVHGRLCATTCQLPDRAVVVRLWDGTGAMGAYDVRESGLGGLGSVLGVGFTRSDGQFDVDACLCAASRAVAVAGTQVALGVSDDTASWTSRADEVRVGAQPHLVVHAYATPGNAAAVGDLGVFPVRSSASTLAVQAPTTVAWTGATRSIPVTVSLADRSGAGAARAVQVAYAFANPAWQPDPAWPTSVTTDAKTGLASFTLTTGGGPADPTGALVITATLPAGDPLLAGATGSATAALQAPLEMGIDVPRPNVQLGERLEATATLTSRGAPARGVEVTASLGAIPLGKASTNAAGKATFSVVLANLPAGPRLLTLRVPPGPLLQEAHATASISIGTGSLLAATVPDHLQSGQMLHVVGTLLRGDQTALGGVSLDVEMDGRGLGSV